jgi:hypothetical protein
MALRIIEIDGEAGGEPIRDMEAGRDAFGQTGSPA